MKKQTIQSLVLGACLAGGIYTAHAQSVNQVGDVFYIDMENHNWTQPQTVGEGDLISTTNQASALGFTTNGTYPTLDAYIGKTYDPTTTNINGAPSQIFGSAAAPYINSLLDTNPANNPVLAAGSYVSYASAYHNVLATPNYTNSTNPPAIHPSEPNYLWQEAGNNFGVLNDNYPFQTTGGVTQVQLIKNNMTSNGLSTNTLSGLLQNRYGASGWKSYQEDTQLQVTSGSVNNPGANGSTSLVAPTNQWTVPFNNLSGTSATYTNAYNGSHQYNFATKHDGQLFFSQTAGNFDTTTNNVSIPHYAPLQQLTNDLASNTVAKYNLITPDQYNDQHTALNTTFTYHGTNWVAGSDGNQIAMGDNFLSIIIPQIMSSYAFTNTINPGAIVIWNDETETGTNANTYATTSMEIVISDLAAGATNGTGVFNDTNNLTHSSDLATLQQLFGVSDPSTTSGYLGDASNAVASGNTINAMFVANAVPEPSSYLLFGLGALALVIAYRRRQA